MSLVQKNAPQFTTSAVMPDGSFNDNLSLSDYKDKWVVLYFYPLDYTFVCPTEITAMSDAVSKFEKLGTTVLGCSVDSKFSHLSWINTPRSKGGLGKLNHPLLADLTKDIGRDYGVLLPAGITLRGLYIIDPAQVVRYEVVNDLGIGRSVNETLRVLTAIQTVDRTGEVCPADWTEGSDTMKADPKDSMEWFSKHNK
ncbi:MAG: peroxiredoxin [Nitrospinota bacterium]